MSSSSSMSRRNDDDEGSTSNSKSSIYSLMCKFPGFRFSPTDEELISYYLNNKIASQLRGGGFDFVNHNNKIVEEEEVIPLIDFCKSEPWDLPGKSTIKSDNEWFFFSPRGRKYPNGSQSKRATEYGYWKATGKERILKSSIGGTKRTLVFHLGRAPKGQRTEWIMHEYSSSMLPTNNSQDSLVVCRLRKNIDFRLNDAANQDSNNNMQHIAQDGGSKKCSSSSHGSHSVDSESESEEKRRTNVVSQDPNPSNPQEEENEEEEDDDCFTDILKDDIINLRHFIANESGQGKEKEGRGMVMQATQATRMDSVQGTANRRMRYTTSDEKKKNDERARSRCMVLWSLIIAVALLVLMSLGVYKQVKMVIRI